jgi:DNA-binding GntR family transcriptional regulator
VNSGATAERVYEALRMRILTGEFRPGDRLDPGVLAETLASSVTPVREALHILTGERLVQTRTSSGFHLPAIDAPALADLYQWNGEVLDLFLRQASSQTASFSATVDSASLPLAERMADLAQRLSRATGNVEHIAAVRALNARLHSARLAEPRALKDTDDEFTALRQSLEQKEAGTLRRILRTYHRRRQRAAAEIVRAIYRPRESCDQDPTFAK